MLFVDYWLIIVQRIPGIIRIEFLSGESQVNGLNEWVGAAQGMERDSLLSVGITTQA